MTVTIDLKWLNSSALEILYWSLWKTIRSNVDQRRVIDAIEQELRSRGVFT